jgi:hypothetical protein
MMVAKDHEIIAYIVSKQRIKYFAYKFFITCNFNTYVYACVRNIRCFGIFYFILKQRIFKKQIYVVLSWTDKG